MLGDQCATPTLSSSALLFSTPRLRHFCESAAEPDLLDNTGALSHLSAESWTVQSPPPRATPLATPSQFPFNQGEWRASFFAECENEHQLPTGLPRLADCVRKQVPTRNFPGRQAEGINQKGWLMLSRIQIPLESWNQLTTSSPTRSQAKTSERAKPAKPSFLS